MNMALALRENSELEENTVLHRACAKCREYFALIKEYPVEVNSQTRSRSMRFHNINGMMEASRNGCHLCTLILTEMDQETRTKLMTELRANRNTGEHMLAIVWHQITQSRDRIPRAIYEPILRIEEPRIEPGVLNRRTVCDLKIFPLETDEQVHRLTNPVSDSTRSWETFNTLHHWLRVCEATHSKCVTRRQAALRQLPTRLLYVNAFGAESNISLRESSRIPIGTRYITLSHCWGPTNQGQLKLLTANYDEFTRGIPIRDLPQSFADAVGLTKSLGIDYLWIDSLCIVQDCQTDWAKECTLMSDVYAGSFLNIAANSSLDSRGGIFRPRDPKKVTPFRARISFAPNHWVRKQFVVFPHTWGLGSLNDAPLSQRAWVVQERLLAPRTVHFLAHKVVWECSSLSASESDATGLIEKQSGSVIRNWAVPSARDYERFHRDASCLWKWHDALKLYTKGNLTYDSDKLVAISGVARFIQQELWRNPDIQYYAGLWSYQIEWQLLWYAFWGGSRYTDYRAPSWSWASYNGEASSYYFYHETRHTFLARVLNVQVEAVDAFGSVTGGHLNIRGPMCRAKPVMESLSSDRGKEAKMTLIQTGIQIEFQELIFDELPTIHDEFVLLGVVKSLDLTNTPMMGLILQSTGLKKGEYKRAGFFHIYNWMPQNLREELEYARLHEITRGWGHDTDDIGSEERTDYVDLEAAFADMDLPQDMYEKKDTSSEIYEVVII